MHQPTSTKNRSVLASLRSLVPEFQITDFRYTLGVIERQAEALLQRYGQDDGPTPDNIVTRFPRVRVVLSDNLPSSGASRWNGSQWIIFVRRSDCRTRRRFTMMHELAHIVHHGYGDRLFAGREWLPNDQRITDAARQRERAADYFAGCVLMPRTQVFALWARGGRTAADVAAYFDVSEAAAKVRLEQLELFQPRWFCTRGLPRYDGRPAPAYGQMRRRFA